MNSEQSSFSIIIPVYKESKKFADLLTDIRDEVDSLRGYKLYKVIITYSGNDDLLSALKCGVSGYEATP